MGWDIIYHPQVASEDLPSIPANLRARIRRALEERLAIAPDRYGVRLRRDLAGSWKLRVGDYRVVFDLDAARRRVIVLVIAHRRVVYGSVSKRR